MRRKRKPLLLLAVFDLLLAAVILLIFLLALHGPAFLMAVLLPAAPQTEEAAVSADMHTETEESNNVTETKAEERTAGRKELQPEAAGEKEESSETDAAEKNDGFPASCAARIGGGEIDRYESENIVISLTRHEMKEEKSVITFFVAEIRLRDPACLLTAFPSDHPSAWPEILARDEGAVLAVNGDYCTSIHKGLIIRNGEVLQDSVGTADLCVLYGDGSMDVFEAHEMPEIRELIKEQPWQVWSFGPSLLDPDGRSKTDFNTGVKLLKANPRTAIGYYGPGHYCFVVADGRQPGYSDGATMEQLSVIFENLGCLKAYNLDGGSSSCMVFNGKRVSRPSGGGRPVSDLVMIREKESERK